MKIRSQFVLLLAGIIAMPFLSVALILLVDYYRSPERARVPDYAEIRSISGTEVDKGAWEKIARFISRKPSQIEHIILDSSALVLYSTMPSIAQKSVLANDEILALIRETGDTYLWQIETSGETESTAITVFTLLERHKHRPPDPFLRLFVWILLLIGMIFAFTGIMILVIARSIARSVTLLEESTRRIANGELDAPVELRGSNEITSLAVSLNRMRVALKEESSRKARFIMGISHDLKTPLALIKGYAEAISDGFMDEPAERERSLALVASKVDQLGGMIDDLIGYVKLDSGDWRKTFLDVDLRAVVGAAVGRISEDAKLLGRDISFVSSVDCPTSVSMDERLFMRALENLVNNAIRYTEAGGTVLVALERTDAGFSLSVRDDGCGIASDDLPHVFELFYRGTSSRREEGMGLGLSIVKSVVESHGWTVDIASREGQGTSVTISIPADTARLEHE